MKRTLAIVLAALLALTMLFSFASADELEMCDIPGMTAAGVLPIVTEETQLTISMAQSAMVTDYDDNALTKMVEADTGIDIVWDLLPAAETATVLDLRFSSGEELSDIIVYNFGSAGASSYGAQGIFQPLNEYIDKYAYFLYNGVMTDAQIEEFLGRIKEADGNQYGYSYYVDDYGDQIKVEPYVNMVWLQKLGMEKPTNLDELYNMLVAFRDNDMNGNGDITDEFPMITSDGPWNGGYQQYLINNFIYWDPDYMLNVADDKVYAPFVTDEWQQAMIYINKLVSENLLAPISLTMTREEYAQMLEAQPLDAQICGMIVGSTAHIVVDHSNPYLLAYDPLDPFEGQYTPNRVAQMTPNFFISTDCDTPEIAYRFFDYFAQPRVSEQLRYGQIGDILMWRDDDPAAFDAIYPNAKQLAYTMGYDAVFARDYSDGKKDPWSNQNNTIWNIQFCGMNPPQLYCAQGSVNPVSDFIMDWNQSWEKQDITAHLDYVAAAMTSWIGVLPEQRFVEPKYTVEESDQYLDTINTVKTFVRESIASFATGAMDPEADWDSYLSQLDAAGLQDWLDVAQTYWDRH